MNLFDLFGPKSSQQKIRLARTQINWFLKWNICKINFFTIFAITVCPDYEVIVSLINKCLLQLYQL